MTKTDPFLEQYRQEISNKTFIDWSSVTYSDLRKPLYSAIATELSAILKTRTGSFPHTIDQQAVLWSNNGLRDSNLFVIAVKELERGLMFFIILFYATKECETSCISLFTFTNLCLSSPPNKFHPVNNLH